MEEEKELEKEKTEERKEEKEEKEEEKKEEKTEEKEEEKTEVKKEEKVLDDRKKKIKGIYNRYIKDRYDLIFIIVLIAAFIIRLWIFSVTKDQAIWWDAGDYLSTAKRWAGVNPNLIDMWYYRRGIFWPLLAAGIFKLGLGDHFLRFIVVLMSTGIVLLTYLLISKMFNKKYALYTSIAVTLSWIFIFFSGRPLTSLPATFFLLLATLFFWKGYMLDEGIKNYALMGIFFAIAIMTRMQYLMYGLLFLPIILVKDKLGFFKKKGLWVALLFLLIFLIPQYVSNSSHYENPIGDLIKFHLFGIDDVPAGDEVVAPPERNIFIYVKNLPYLLDGNQAGYNSLFALSPIYILFVIGFILFFGEMFLGFDRIFKNKEVQKRFFVFVFTVGTLLIMGFLTHLEQRYVMQIYPFLMLIAVYPIALASDYLTKKFKFKEKHVIIVVSVVLVLLLVPNFMFGNSLMQSKKSSYYEVKLAGEWIKANSEPEDKIVSASFPQITYYSERSTYPFYLAYRRDLADKWDQADFEEFVETEKPRYIMVSVFESAHPEWLNSYLAANNETWVPVNGYQQNGQPVVIIYENSNRFQV